MIYDVNNFRAPSPTAAAGTPVCGGGQTIKENVATDRYHTPTDFVVMTITTRFDTHTHTHTC